MAVTRTFCLAAGLAVVLPGSLISQTRVRGVVVDSGTGAPLESARIVGPRGITYSDGFGRFVVAIDSFPSRIVIVRIGSRATSVIVAQAPDTLLRIPLAAVPVRIADLVVEGTTDHDATDLGRWTVPLDRGTLLPMVQPDVLRALAASPAVTQSTIVSARPLVRGYDPGEATLLLDGFELPNPYHLARAFSAIPAVGVERVTVATAPTAITIGGTSGAAVELTGRTGPTGSPTGGVAVDPVSLTGWLGGAPGGVRLFGAGRAVTLGALATLAGKRFAYGFNDGYASVIVDRGGAPWLRTTLFGSHDRVEDQGGGDAMSWGVAMLGTRVDLWRRGGAGIALSGYATRFDERIDRLALRSSLVDVDNDYSRVGGALEWRASAGGRRLQLGFAPSWRRIRNRVSVLGGSLFPAALDDGRPEYAGYGSWSERVGRVEVELGVRFDGSAGAGAWQPRARGDWDLGKGWSVGVAAGRSARLYQTVSDPNGEPELVFYDLWFVAGRGGIPVSRVDHAFLSTSWRHAGFSFRAGAYVSRGAGIVEVRPETDQQIGTSALRIGDSRTRGLEWQGGYGGADRSVTISYALSWSDRDWGNGWVPWSQDRRHLVRLAAQSGLGHGWAASTMVEAMSAAPLTPVAYVAPNDPSALGGSTAAPAYVYGPEGSARGSGTVRIDLGLERRFGGPWGSRGSVSVSVTNLAFGPVAPLHPEDVDELEFSLSGPHPVRYGRLFKLPAIPAVGLKFEF